jgi:hypothetical protein
MWVNIWLYCMRRRLPGADKALLEKARLLCTLVLYLVFCDGLLYDSESQTRRGTTVPGGVPGDTHREDEGVVGGVSEDRQ